MDWDFSGTASRRYAEILCVHYVLDWRSHHFGGFNWLMDDIIFQSYAFPAEKVLHLAMIAKATGKGLIVQSASVKGHRARIFGTMRQPWWVMLTSFKRLTLNPDAIRKQFLAQFESLCREHEITHMVGAVPKRLWERSYKQFTGFKATGKYEDSVKGQLVLVEKVLE